MAPGATTTDGGGHGDKGGIDHYGTPPRKQKAVDTSYIDPGLTTTKLMTMMMMLL